MADFCVREVGIGQVSARQVHPAEVCTDEGGQAQVRLTEVSMPKISSGQVRRT